MIEMIYKRLFNEKAMSVSDAEQLGYCLYVKKTAKECNIFLYNPKVLTKKNFSKLDGTKFILNSLIGVCQMNNVEHAYKAWEVRYTGAQKGWGIILYDLMLSIAGKQGLEPNRASVSPMARKVWDYYFTKRKSEITTKPIDDMDKPLTKSKVDDEYVHEPFEGKEPLEQRSVVDRVFYFKSKSSINIQPLIDNHEKFIENTLQNIGVNKLFILNLFNDRMVSTFYQHIKKQREKTK